MNEISDQIKSRYQRRFRKYGFAARSLNWKRLGAAHQRFRQMWAEIDFNEKSVLDVGCGFGEMAKFLRKRYKAVEYVGVDIVPEFIKVAKKLYPEFRFEVRDYFNDPLPEKFDVVLASGTLNSNVSDNIGYRRNAIKVMFEHTNKVLAFNMSGAHPPPENDSKNKVWYADSLEILEYCMSLTRRVLLKHHYHRLDFTIFMYPVKRKI